MDRGTRRGGGAMEAVGPRAMVDHGGDSVRVIEPRVVTWRCTMSHLLSQSNLDESGVDFRVVVFGSLKPLACLLASLLSDGKLSTQKGVGK